MVSVINLSEAEERENGGKYHRGYMINTASKKLRGALA